MSFLKRLFGGGGSREAESRESGTVGEAVEHKGFTIRATPYKSDGQFQTCGVISKMIDGVRKEHRFVRADKFTTPTDAADMALKKGQQIVEEQGERVFI